MQQRIPFESKEALELSDDIMECIYYHALKKKKKCLNYYKDTF